MLKAGPHRGPRPRGGARLGRFKSAGRGRCIAGPAAGPQIVGAGVRGRAHRAGRAGLGAPCGRHPTMLKRCGRRLLLALAGALLACLLVLTADPPPPPVPAERGRRALRSLAGPSGAAPAPGLEAAAAPGVLVREVHSLSEYFSLLTRSRRDAGPPPGSVPRPADSHPRPPAEPLTPHDVFIAVKTTKKFHRARLDLLLETWISRHKEMVSPRSLGKWAGEKVPSCPAGGSIRWAPGCTSVQPLGVSGGVMPVCPLPAQCSWWGHSPHTVVELRAGDPSPANFQGPGWPALTPHQPPVPGVGALRCFLPLRHWNSLTGHYCPQTSPRQILHGRHPGLMPFPGKKTLSLEAEWGVRTPGLRRIPIPVFAMGQVTVENILKLGVGVSGPWGVHLKRKRALGFRVCSAVLSPQCRSLWSLEPCAQYILAEHRLPPHT